MAECTVLSIDKEGSGMVHGVVCMTCGLERSWRVRDCKLCKVVARNVAFGGGGKGCQRFVGGGKAAVGGG